MNTQANLLDSLGISPEVLSYAARETARIHRVLKETWTMQPLELAAQADAVRSLALGHHHAIRDVLSTLGLQSSSIEQRRRASTHSHRKRDMARLPAGNMERELHLIVEDVQSSVDTRETELARGEEEGTTLLSEQNLIAEPAQGGAAQNCFRRSGECWEIVYEGNRKTLKNSVGLERIHALLREAGRHIPSQELVGVLGASPGEELLDAQASLELNRRLEEIREELQAETDPAQQAELSEEQGQLETHLKAAQGIGGRSRRQGDDYRRASSRCGVSIRRAIRAIRDGGQSELADHLRKCIVGRASRAPMYQRPERLEWRLD